MSRANKGICCNCRTKYKLLTKDGEINPCPKCGWMIAWPVIKNPNTGKEDWFTKGKK